jgi:hypothetical protein
MGMSASQARFLCLTAQKSNNEHRTMQLTWERLQLAQNTEAEAIKYNDALEARIMLFGENAFNSHGANYNARLTYENIINDLDGFLMSSGGNVVVRSEEELKVPVQGENETNEAFEARFKKYEELLNKFEIASDLSDEEKFEQLKKNALIDPRLKDPQHLEDSIRAGVYGIDAEGASREISDVQDKRTIEEAQKAKDEADAKFARIDKMFDMDLKKLATEHKALDTEIESVKKIIQTNIEKTYNTFG